MEEVKKEERERFLPSFVDHFSFNSFLYPQLLFAHVEQLQVIYAQTPDGIIYIRGGYKVWLGLHSPKSPGKCCLRVFPRRFCYLVENPAGQYPGGDTPLDCESEVEINFSRLWGLNFAAKIPFIPWKINVKVKIIYNGFQYKKIQVPSVGQTIATFPEESPGREAAETDAPAEESEGKRDELETAKGTRVFEGEDQLKSGYKKEKTDNLWEKEDLIALEQESKAASPLKKRSQDCYSQKGTKRYRYYDLIFQQLEGQKEKNKN
mgnify:CR=1 FL=1